MKNNNTQTSNTPQQQPIDPIPPTPKKINKPIIIIILLIIVLVIIAGLTPLSILNRPSKIKPILINPTTTTKQLPTQLPTKLPTITSMPISLDKELSSIPTEWGKIIKIENYSNYKEIIPNVYTINFENDVTGFFHEGVRLISYNKIKDKGNCIEIAKKSGQKIYEPDHSDDTCYIIEEGIYNLNTKKSVIIGEGSRFSFLPLFYPAPFTLFDNKSSKDVKAIFSPQGKYLTHHAQLYEGCGLDIVDTTTGQTLKNQIEVEGKNYPISFGCNPLLDFSKDEKTFTLRGVYEQMINPTTQFTVIQLDKRWEILPKLISRNYDYWNPWEVNPVNDFKITSVNDNEVKFDITKETSFYKRGRIFLYCLTNNLSKNKLKLASCSASRTSNISPTPPSPAQPSSSNSRP